MGDNRIIWDGWFSIIIPDGWSYQEDEGVISIYKDEGGVGALQISFARRDKLEKPSKKEALELSISFAEKRGWRIKDEEIDLLDIDGCPTSEFVIKKDEDIDFWQVWHIVNDKRAAFITYVCSSDESEVEEGTRVAIVEAFRWEGELKASDKK